MDPILQEYAGSIKNFAYATDSFLVSTNFTLGNRQWDLGKQTYSVAFSYGLQPNSWFDDVSKVHW